jgi:hypothetical protein
MKKLIFLLFIFNFTESLGQRPFSNCAAAFLNKKMIVENYDKSTTAKIAKNAKGEFSVGTVSLSTTESKLTGNIKFSLAIKDGNTGTLLLFTPTKISKIDVQKILSKCKVGDCIIVLTTKNEYVLPHNEILVF